MTTSEFAEIGIAIRALLALVFLTAAVGKMRHWAVLHGVIANYRLLPDGLVAPVAYALPPIEAILAATLLVGSMSPWPEAGAAALLLVFAAAMGVNLIRGRRDIDCGCFQSALKQGLSWILVVRNVVLALLLGVAILSMNDAADLRAALEGLLVGGVAFILLQALNTLWSIVPAWQRPHHPGSEDGL